MTNLRAVNNVAFLYRERARFRVGSSELLGLTLEPVTNDGVVVDARAVEELYAVTTLPSGAATVGAFVTRTALAQALPDLCPPDASLSNVRVRLSLRDARVTVYGGGRQRTVALDGLTLAPHELPATIDLAPPRPGLGIAERRRTTNDGTLSHTVGVTVALRISVLARFEHVRIIIDADGSMRRAAEAEAKLEKQRCQPDVFPDVARLATLAFPAVDARTSAIARSIPPLVLAALRDAFQAAR